MSSKNISIAMIEVIPIVMRSIRSEMRGLALPELSVAQFRILSRLDRGPQSNKALAEWVGVSTAAMSRTIEVLVNRQLVQRAQDKQDRREVVLSLSPAGKRKYETIKETTRKKLMHRIDQCSKAEQKQLSEGLLVLQEIFCE